MWDGVSMACSYTLQSVHYIVSNSSVQLCYSGIALALASAFCPGTDHQDNGMKVDWRAQVFEKHCVNAWDDDRNAWRSCFSDEHYFATVLATQGVDRGKPSLEASVSLRPPAMQPPPAPFSVIMQ